MLCLVASELELFRTQSQGSVAPGQHSNRQSRRLFPGQSPEVHVHPLPGKLGLCSRRSAREFMPPPAKRMAVNPLKVAVCSIYLERRSIQLLVHLQLSRTSALRNSLF
jgi:hypothetical protein